MKNITIINKHSQIRELGSNLKYSIIKELIVNPATCQQLAAIFELSKQKVHYSLTRMLEEGLIEIAGDMQNNNKEVYYRATARNYILDFSLGDNVSSSTVNSREIINSILTNEYRLNLQGIASNILDNSLRMKPKETLLLVTGKYNLPLVEKILIEAARRMIRVNLIYHDLDFLNAKNDEFSLAVFNADFEYFNKLLSVSDVYLNLNGESRHVELKDSKKQDLKNRHYEKSRQIINAKKIRVAIMPGLLHDTLSENSIISELQFWKALDVDYTRQCEETLSLCRTLADKQKVEVEKDSTSFSFKVKKVLCESGSFSDNPFQSPVINLPGGEVLVLPEVNTLNGIISSELAFAYGEKIINPIIEIRDNAIVSFKADCNEHLIAQAIEKGGADGRKVALICLGTNSNIRLENIDTSYKHKSNGLMTVYWGENQTLGGNVAGLTEWFIQIEKPTITYQ